jgi:cytoskeletal protein CcmA (bactofilin family)
MAIRNEGSAELNLIGAGSVFEGKLKTPGSIRIDGKVIGEITATQNISIGGTGDIEGNLSARNITVGGKVSGAIAAQEKLVLEARAVVKGDLRSSKLVIDEGAVFDGKCAMGEARQSGNVVELKSEARRAEER